jgi:hypothetical protein
MQISENKHSQIANRRNLSRGFATAPNPNGSVVTAQFREPSTTEDTEDTEQAFH